MHMKAGIAGGGIMGQLLALALVNHGWRVSIFDNSDGQSCSMAAAGMLAPTAELDKCDLLINELGEEALSTHWPCILNQLPSDIYFQQTGSIILSHQHNAAELTRFIHTISNKIKHSLFYRALNNDTLHELEPDLSSFNHCCYFPNEGQIDNQQLLLALKQRLLACDVTWHHQTTVVSINPWKIKTDDGSHDVDLACDCRGLGAMTSYPHLRSIRGELIWLEAQDIHISRPIRFLHPRYNLYLVPRPNHTYLVGASEIESEDYSPISTRTMMELLTAAYCVNPKFTEARIIKTITQCRPTLLNHLPKIGYTDGLVAINGLYRHGFLIAPTLANEVMRWADGKSTTKYKQLWEKIT